MRERLKPFIEAEFEQFQKPVKVSLPKGGVFPTSDDKSCQQNQANIKNVGLDAWRVRTGAHGKDRSAGGTSESAHPKRLRKAIKISGHKAMPPNLWTLAVANWLFPLETSALIS